MPLSVILAVILIGIGALAVSPVFGGNHGFEGAKNAQKGLNEKVLPNGDVVGTAVGLKGGQAVLKVFTARKDVVDMMLEDLMADPDHYFWKLQARSALFDEDAYRTTSTSSGWLWFGIYVLVGLVCAAACGYLAVTRGLLPLPWFFAGLVGNVAAVTVLLVARKGDPGAAVAGVPKGLAKVPTTRSPHACETCQHLNHPSAKACSHCGQPMEPTARSEVARLSGSGQG